jgi:maleate isomerase
MITPWLVRDECRRLRDLHKAQNILLSVIKAVPSRQPSTQGEEMLERTAFLAKVDAILNTLLKKTNASRTTLRVDLPRLQLNVNAPAAEALAAGVHSIKDKTSLDQRNAVAVKWLEKNRRVFVENNCLNTTPDIAPEKEVTGEYGIRSEMVAPILYDDYLIGWVSVHNIRGPHQWTSAEIAAIESASVEVRKHIEAVEKTA